MAQGVQRNGCNQTAPDAASFVGTVFATHGPEANGGNGKPMIGAFWPTHTYFCGIHFPHFCIVHYPIQSQTFQILYFTYSFRFHQPSHHTPAQKNWHFYSTFKKIKIANYWPIPQGFSRFLLAYWVYTTAAGWQGEFPKMMLVRQI